MSSHKARLVESVGAAESGNMLVHGDCLASCSFLKELIDAGRMPPVDLVYIDRAGLVIEDGRATGRRWDACVYSDLPPRRVRVRSIRGDEVVRPANGKLSSGPPLASVAARGGGEAEPFEMGFPERLLRLARKPYLDVHVADHCNLRCAGCVHFAPVAEPRLLDLDAFERDLAALAAIPGVCRYFEALCLMGGEPTLHPGLPDALRLARRHLPGMPIALDTNGLLLRRMGDGFWEAMAEADVELVLSPYPIGVDYRALVDLAEGQGVRAALAGDVTGAGRGKEAFFRLALDGSGSQDPVHAFNGCPFGGTYLQLHEGALWPCQVAARHGALNAAFGASLAACDDDRLPLGAIGSTSEIDAFRRRAHAMCRFCDNDRLAVVPWGRSKRERGEWLADGAGA